MDELETMDLKRTTKNQLVQMLYEANEKIDFYRALSSAYGQHVSSIQKKIIRREISDD